jgi:hypothetical protein
MLSPKPHRALRRTTAWISAIVALFAILTTASTAAATASPMVVTPSGFQSPLQVALAQFNGNLYMAWVGTGGNHPLNVASSTNVGRTWSQAVQVGANRSPSAPALAVWNGKLWIAWNGTDNDHTLNLASSTNGTQFTQAAQPLGGNRSPYGPSLAVYNNVLYYAWTGGDSQHLLNIASSTNGVNFTSPIHLGQNGSIRGPKLAAVGSLLWMAWTGTDANHFLNIANSTNGFASFTEGNHGIYQVSTLHQPSMASYDHNISPPISIFEYTGTDNNLYQFDSVSGPAQSRLKRLASSIVEAPALTVLQDGTIVTAWIDNSANISVCSFQLGGSC